MNQPLLRRAVARLHASRFLPRRFITATRHPRLLALTLGLLASLSVIGQPASIMVANGEALITSASNQTFLFQVTSSGDSSYDRHISYRTVDDSAVAGTDYLATSGALKLAAGASTGQIPVTANGKSGSGPLADKTLKLEIDSVVGTGPEPSFAALKMTSIAGLGTACTPDLNGDGLPDLVAPGSANGSSVEVRLNITSPGAADPSFTAQTLVPSSIGSDNSECMVADLDLDGREDVVYGNGNGLLVGLNRVSPGASSLSFMSVLLQNVGSSIPAQMIDINVDGRPDFMSGSRAFLNTSSGGNFSTAAFNGVTTGAAISGNAAYSQVADLDGDGRPDVVATTVFDKKLQVFINKVSPGATSLGAGAFEVFDLSLGLYNPDKLAIRDLNGDGRPDLVVFVSGAYLIFLNQAAAGTALTAASFGSPIVIFAAVNNATGVKAVDVNADGLIDLVRTDSPDRAMAVLMNRVQPGTELRPTSFAVLPRTPAGLLNGVSNLNGLASADFNLDGKPDLVAANGGDSSVTVFMNRTPASGVLPAFAPQPAVTGLGQTSTAAAADFNGDGRLDVAVVDKTSGSTGVNVLLNTTAAGATTLSTAAPVRTALLLSNVPQEPTVTDFNGDGRPDLLLASETAGRPLAVLINSGTVGATDSSGAQFTTTLVGGMLRARQAEVADLNGDGRPDAVVRGFGDELTLLRNTSDGSLIPSVASAGVTNTVCTGSVNDLCSSTSRHRLADFDGDGRPDIATLVNVGSNVYKLTVLRNTTALGETGNFSFTPAFAAPQDVGNSAVEMRLADFDGDGRIDIVVLQKNLPNGVLVLRNTTPAGGNISFASSVLIGTSLGVVDSLRLADFNGDGRPDLLVGSDGANSSANNPNAQVLLNTSTPGSVSATSLGTQNLPPSAGAAAMVVGDFDLDGRTDIGVSYSDLSGSGTYGFTGFLNTQFRASGAPYTATGTIRYNLPVPLSASPVALDFGAQAIGANSAPLTLTINDSSATAGAFSITTGSHPGDFGVVSGSSTCSGSNNPCTVQVRFNPGANGARSATLRYTSGAGTLDVPLSGTGASLDLGTVNAGSEVTQAYTVTNASASSVSLALFMTTGNGFSIAPGGSCAAVLAGNSSCTVNVRFAPAAGGLATATLSYTRNAAAQTVALSGTATGATASSANANSDVVYQPHQTSADGRYLVFNSSATDLVPGQVDSNNTQDTFLYDRDTGSVSLISHRGDGKTTGDNYSGSVAISGDGRYILMLSGATNLRPGLSGIGPSNPALFLYDRNDASLKLVNYSNAGMNVAADGSYRIAALSRNGTHVAFSLSGTTNVGVPGLVATPQPFIEDANYFLYNIGDGSLKLINHTGGAQNILPDRAVNAFRAELSISDDGSQIAFVSPPSNLGVSGLSHGGSATAQHGFVYRTADGNLSLVTHASSLSTTSNGFASNSISMSGDGRSISFHSNSSNLGVAGLNDGNNDHDVFVYDIATQDLVLVSREAATATTTGNAASINPRMSADGRYVVYESVATNLVTGQDDSNNSHDVFVFDRQSGTQTLVSKASGSLATTGNLLSRGPNISANGALVTFYSGAGNLVAGFVDGNPADAENPDGYLYDIATGTVTLVSHVPGSPTVSGNQRSAPEPLIISADGSRVYYASRASNLEFGLSDVNAAFDVIEHNTATGENRYVSRHVETLPAQIMVSPASLVFGDQLVGVASANQTVTVKNTGDAGLMLGSLSLTGAQASEFAIGSDTCSGQTLVGGAECTVAVAFSPATVGAKTGALSIPTNLSGSPSTVALSGTGVQPGVSLSPSPAEFGQVRVYTSPTLTVQLTNTGSAPLVVGQVPSISGDFYLTVDTCSNRTVPVDSGSGGNTCAIVVGFTPTTAGLQTQSLIIPTNAGPQTLMLSGTGTQSGLGLSGFNGAFGNQPVGLASAEQSVIVTNTGTALLQFNSVSVTGGNAADFSITDNGCTLSVAVSGTCTIKLRFTPGGSGARGASLIIASTAPTSPDTLSLSGTGTQPTVTLSANPLSLSENGGQSTLTATLSEVSGQAVTVSLLSSGTASAADYTLPASIVIPAGQLSATATLAATQDLLFEGDETVTVDISAVSNASESGDQQVSITITDDEVQPTVSFAAASQTVGEADGNALVTVQLSGASTQTVTVNYSLGGTADGGDYSVTGNASPLTFAPGETGKTITLALVADAVDEPDETVTLTLGTITNATAGAIQLHTLTLNDNNDTPRVSFALAASSAAEGTASHLISVTLDAASALPVSVPFTISGTAADGTDYTHSASPLVIPAGATGVMLTVSVTDDAISEGDETAIFTLGAPTNALNGTVSVHTLTLTDNDAAPSVSLSATPLSISEAAAVSTLTATLSALSGQNVTVNLSQTAGNASAADYSLPANIVIPAGQLSATADFRAVDDAVFEGNETATISMGTLVNATAGAATSVGITIVDNDSPPPSGGGGGGSSPPPEPPPVQSLTFLDALANPVTVSISQGNFIRAGLVATPETVPGDFIYPAGFFAIDINRLTPGATVTLRMQLPSDYAVIDYIKCVSACAPFAGAVIEGTLVTLTLTDGGAGDADGLANGVITDPGAPAFALPPVEPESPAPAGGGGAWDIRSLLLLLGLLLFRRTAGHGRRVPA